MNVHGPNPVRYLRAGQSHVHLGGIQKSFRAGVVFGSWKVVDGHIAKAGRKGISNVGNSTSEVGEVGSHAQPLDNGEDLFQTSHAGDAQLQAAVGWRASAPSQPFTTMCSLRPDFLRAALVFP